MLALAAAWLVSPSAAEAADWRSAAALRDPAISSERQADIPAVFATADAFAYRRVFALQEQGDWSRADQEIARLRDRTLLGHVLAQRYLHPRYRSSPAELAAWLSAYADHPDAGAIYRTAERRVRAGYPLRRPVGETLGGSWAADDLGPPPDRTAPPGRKLSSDAQARAGVIKTRIRREMRAGDLLHAERLLGTREAARLLSDGEIDHIRAQIAAGWFAQGDDGKALELAAVAASRSADVVPRAHWIAGLALFKQGHFGDAAQHFEALARTPGGEPWDVSSGAFWASRTHARARRFEVVNYWLEQAAEHPRTFYGLLAIRQLGIPMPFVWEPPFLTDSDVDAIRRLPAGTRAFALIQIGQGQRAEAELRRVFASGGPGQTRALLAIAMRANLPGLSIRLGRELADLDGRRHDGALYPIPPWVPQGGYQVDRALVFAFMRQESQFNTRAVSFAGARGLMQLMPQTAAHIDGASFRGRADLLLDPVYNVTLGQRYLAELLQHDSVQGDLIRLAAAYNGGPGNLIRWTRKQDARGGPEEDALLFIESLPAPETRHFITRILYGYWMYSERLGQPTPSLDEIAAGQWPAYSAVEIQTAMPPRRNAQAR